jgi:hypothetical protein
VGRPDNVSTQHIPDAFSQTNLRPPTQFPLNPRRRIAGRTDQAVDDFAQSAIQTPCRAQDACRDAPKKSRRWRDGASGTNRIVNLPPLTFPLNRRKGRYFLPTPYVPAFHQRRRSAPSSRTCPRLWCGNGFAPCAGRTLERPACAAKRTCRSQVIRSRPESSKQNFYRFPQTIPSMSIRLAALPIRDRRGQALL